MTITEMLAGGGGATLIIMTLIQISPLKFNPWSALAGVFGRAINRELVEMIYQLDGKVETLTEDVQNLDAARERDNAKGYRTQILRFGDEILHETPRHSKEHFDDVLRTIALYDKYCAEHPEFENGVTEVTSERIKTVYKERLLKKDFL